jgi:hypothetical protein
LRLSVNSLALCRRVGVRPAVDAPGKSILFGISRRSYPGSLSRRARNEPRAESQMGFCRVPISLEVSGAVEASSALSGLSEKGRPRRGNGRAALLGRGVNSHWRNGVGNAHGLGEVLLRRLRNCRSAQITTNAHNAIFLMTCPFVWPTA